MSDWASAPESSVPAQPQADWTSAPPVGPSPQAKAVVGAMDNPEDAGKALSISARTGIPAPVVQTDIPGYDAHARTQDAIAGVKNPYIAAYVDGNPMAARVSADDYPKLDEVSQQIQTLNKARTTGTKQALSIEQSD